MKGYTPRKTVLALNAELRKKRRTFALPDHSGHIAFQMAALDYWAWVHKYPELGASDPTVARKAWMKFLNSDEGAQYKVNPTEGKRTHFVPLLSK